MICYFLRDASENVSTSTVYVFCVQSNTVRGKEIGIPKLVSFGRCSHHVAEGGCYAGLLDCALQSASGLENVRLHALLRRIVDAAAGQHHF